MLHHRTLSTRERFAILADCYPANPLDATPIIRQCLCGATVYQYLDGSKIDFGNGHARHQCGAPPKPPTPVNGSRLDKPTRPYASLRRTNAATIV